MEQASKSNMIQAIEGLSGMVRTDNDTYVGEDGLLYCAKCHTARQCKISLFGEERIVNCICECMKQELDREEEERKLRERIRQLDRLRDAGFPDAEMRKCTFAADDGATPQIAQAMRNYVDNFAELRKSGKGLLLYGNVGTGKSFYAACIVNALIDKGYPCMMTNFSRLTNKIGGRWEGKQEYIDGLTRYRLIAIDDLGVERDTDYMNENVTTIIDSLYRAKVPLIITSNFAPKQLLSGDTDLRRSRVYDRLLEVCYPVAVNGVSRRKQKGRDDIAAMRDILGI